MHSTPSKGVVVCFNVILRKERGLYAVFYLASTLFKSHSLLDLPL